MTDADTARREGVNGAARWCESCHGFLGYVGGKDLPRPYRCKLCAIIAEKDAEIAALQQNDANREALLDSLLRLRNEHILEIAALREFVRWHVMHHPQSWPGNAEIMPAVRRALKERP